jgi:RecJ-like exonuclease
MSCEICHGHPNCPVCGSGHTLTETCPDCHGEGCIRYDEDGNDLTREQFNQTPADQRTEERCSTCHGTGIVEAEEYEPEYEPEYQED